MNRSVLGLAMALAVTTLGCDDDGGDEGAVDGGMDAAVAVMCKGTFATLNRTQLGAATSPTGQCAAPADLDVICANDVRALTGLCGQGCFAQDPTTVPACTNQCVAAQLDPDLGAACSNCYTNAVVCTLQNCATVCAVDPNGVPCIQCQTANNCLSTFFTCSGLPGGPPVQPDAGVDGATGDAGGDASTDATPG